MSDGPSTDNSKPDEEWNPQLPWERVAEWLTRTKRARFTTYNVLLFLLVVTAFVATAVTQYGIGGGTDSTTSAVTITPSFGAVVTGAVFQAIVIAPVVALLAGILAGITFKESPRSVAITGGTGAFAGYLPVLGVFLLVSTFTGTEIGSQFGADNSTVQPVATSVGVVLAGGGAAYLTRQFVCSTVNENGEKK